MKKKKIWVILILLSSAFVGLGQSGFFLPNGKSKVEIPFEYVNNFIILTMDYKGFFPLKFIFDTGAEHTILTKVEVAYMFDMQSERSFKVMGADMKTELNAYLVRHAPFSIHNAIEAPNMDLLVLEKDYFSFEDYIGIPIHGILSGRVFSRYLVHINYDKQTITLVAKNQKERFLKGYEPLKLNMSRNKPYLDTKLQLQNDTTIDVRLLVDTGAAITLMLFSNTDENLKPPPNALTGDFGQGLGGSLDGFTGRVNSLAFGPNLQQKGIISFFQNIDTTNRQSFLNERNGLLGNGVLNRFQVIFDYQDSLLYLKPSKNYKERYKFDKSGLHFIATGKNLNDYLVQYIIHNSPADEAGFQKGDLILSVNRISTKFISLPRLIKRLRGKEGKVLRIKIKRDGKKMIKKIELRELL